jgi:hypothetical protein
MSTSAPYSFAGAVTLIEDRHVDGFRVDLTDAIHQNNRVANANLFGIKFLREWSRTVRLLKPAVFTRDQLLANIGLYWFTIPKRA